MKLAETLQLNIQQLQKDMQDPAIENEIQNNIQLAESLRITGTPAFVISHTPKRLEKGTYSAVNFKTTTLKLGLINKQTLQQAITKAKTA
jgi:protein-disulfide isomerase